MTIERFAKKIRAKLETFVEEYPGCDEDLEVWLELFQEWVEE